MGDLADETTTQRFRRIVWPHLDAAYTLARWLTRRPADAEDVVQEAMLRAFRFLDGCHEGTVRPWLLQIVRNVARDRLGVADDIRVVGFADVDPNDADGAAHTSDVFTDPPQDPEDLLRRKDDRRLINDLIAALPVDFREVVILREFEDLSYKEIAGITGIPIGTVMSRLARARDLLQRGWSERHG
jgi:RNA polymerase sigma-70 factor (ECF subfamily)